MIESLKKTKEKHGLSHTSIHYIWVGMRARCYNKNSGEYHNYGARGIRICDEWMTSFLSFYRWATKNNYKKGLCIDRIDVDGNYCPENCRFVTTRVNSLNKRNTLFVTLNGITKPLVVWADILGMRMGTINHRIYYKGWSHEKALLTPLRGMNNSLNDYIIAS